MRYIAIVSLLFALAAFSAACGSSVTNTNNATASAKTCPTITDTPTEAYKRLYSAVKIKNIEAVKAQMSHKSQEFAASMAERQKAPIEEIYKNGFTATTFADSLPEIRDERIKGCWAGLEVRNVKEQTWEDLPFVNEDGSWKFAIAEVFDDTFKSPGESQGQKEAEAANAMQKSVTPPNLMGNVNTATISNKSANAARAPKFTGPEVEPLPKKK